MSGSPDRGNSMEEAFALLAELRQNLELQQASISQDGEGGDDGDGENQIAADQTGASPDAAASGSSKAPSPPAHTTSSAPATRASGGNTRGTSPVAFAKETPRITSLKDQVEQLRRDKKALLTQLDAVEAKLRESAASPSPNKGNGVQPLVSFQEQPETPEAQKNFPPKFVALQNRIETATNPSSSAPTPAANAVMVWEPSDIKFTDEKVMSNLLRRYQLTLVGVALPVSSSLGESTDGPRVGKGAAVTNGGLGGSSAPKRTNSPTASKRLVNPAPAVTVARRTTPGRTTPGGVSSRSAAGGGATTSASTPTSATGTTTRKATPTSGAISRVTPLRRATPGGSTTTASSTKAAAPSSSVAKRPTGTSSTLRGGGPASGRGGATASGTATPDKRGTSPAARKGVASSPGIQARRGTSPTNSSTTRRGAAGGANNGTTTTTTTSSSSAAAAEEGPTTGVGEKRSGGGENLPPALSITAALAPFKGIAPDETPRVPGDGRGPMPAAAAGAGTRGAAGGRKVVAVPSSSLNKTSSSSPGVSSRGPGTSSPVVSRGSGGAVVSTRGSGGRTAGAPVVARPKTTSGPVVPRTAGASTTGSCPVSRR